MLLKDQRRPNRWRLAPNGWPSLRYPDIRPSHTSFSPMPDEADFLKTLVTLEAAQWEYLRRAAFARRTNLSALLRDLVDEAMRDDRWPEVHTVRR